MKLQKEVVVSGGKLGEKSMNVGYKETSWADRGHIGKFLHLQRHNREGQANHS